MYLGNEGGKHELSRTIWFEDTRLGAMYDLALSKQNLSKVMTNIGRMNLNLAFLSCILNETGKADALYYVLTLFSSQTQIIGFLEFVDSRTDYQPSRYSFKRDGFYSAFYDR